MTDSKDRKESGGASEQPSERKQGAEQAEAAPEKGAEKEAAPKGEASEKREASKEKAAKPVEARPKGEGKKPPARPAARGARAAARRKKAEEPQEPQAQRVGQGPQLRRLGDDDRVVRRRGPVAGGGHAASVARKAPFAKSSLRAPGFRRPGRRPPLDPDV